MAEYHSGRHQTWSCYSGRIGFVWHRSLRWARAASGHCCTILCHGTNRPRPHRTGGGFSQTSFAIFTPFYWGDDPIWRDFFCDRLKPPTSHGVFCSRPSVQMCHGNFDEFNWDCALCQAHLLPPPKTIWVNFDVPLQTYQISRCVTVPQTRPKWHQFSVKNWA